MKLAWFPIDSAKYLDSILPDIGVNELCWLTRELAACVS